MAMIDQRADHSVRVPGVYERLLRAQCISETRPDPRLYGADDDGHREREHAEQQAIGQATMLFRRRLQAAEPITVPKWTLGGHSVPVPRSVPMFQDRSVRAYRVYSDDRIEVAERW